MTVTKKNANFGKNGVVPPELSSYLKCALGQGESSWDSRTQRLFEMCTGTRREFVGLKSSMLIWNVHWDKERVRGTQELSAYLLDQVYILESRMWRGSFASATFWEEPARFVYWEETLHLLHFGENQPDCYWGKDKDAFCFRMFWGLWNAQISSWVYFVYSEVVAERIKVCIS